MRHLAVVGTGLMGASVGLAAKRAGVESVTGFDRDPEVLAVALERDAVDVATEALRDAVADADLVVVATPVRSVPDVAVAASVLAGSRTTVTDVGSTKGRICSALAEVASFVGGHPLCGSEASGPGSALANLFDGATWFLTPLPESDPTSRELIAGFVTSLGAVPVEIDPEAHDRLVALVSHLPHALANLLVTQAGAFEIEDHDPLALAGESFREMTRVAGANPAVWADIFLDNAEALGVALGSYRRLIEELEEALRSGDVDSTRRSIENAADRRRRLLGG